MENITRIFIGLAIMASPAHAEVFKCKLASGKTVYQKNACPETTVSQDVIEIKKMDPIKIAEAQQRYYLWEADFAKREAAELKAKKEEQEALARRELIDTLKRSIAAQEELAQAARRPVIIYNNPGFVRNPLHLKSPKF